MRRLLYAVIFLIFVSLILLNNSSFAAHKVGIGVILGDPSGFTTKLFLTDSNAFDAGIGPSGDDGFYLYFDYLRIFRNLFPINELSLYLGAGVGLHHHDKETKHHDEDELSLEARLPIGIAYLFRQIPLEIFLEIAPALEIIPDIDFDLRGGLGARYYF